MTPRQLRDAANRPCESAFHGGSGPYKALLPTWESYDSFDVEGLPKMACFWVCPECGFVETNTEPMA